MCVPAHCELYECSQNPTLLCSIWMNAFYLDLNSYLAALKWYPSTPASPWGGLPQGQMEWSVTASQLVHTLGLCFTCATPRIHKKIAIGTSALIVYIMSCGLGSTRRATEGLSCHVANLKRSVKDMLTCIFLNFFRIRAFEQFKAQAYYLFIYCFQLVWIMYSVKKFCCFYGKKYGKIITIITTMQKWTA